MVCAHTYMKCFSQLSDAGVNDTNHRCTSLLKDGLHFVGLVNKLKLVTKWLVRKWEVNKTKLVEALWSNVQNNKAKLNTWHNYENKELYCSSFALKLRVSTRSYRISTKDVSSNKQSQNFTKIITFIYNIQIENSINKTKY
jgi:hypothetical protein